MELFNSGPKKLKKEPSNGNTIPPSLPFCLLLSPPLPLPTLSNPGLGEKAEAISTPKGAPVTPIAKVEPKIIPKVAPKVVPIVVPKIVPKVVPKITPKVTVKSTPKIEAPKVEVPKVEAPKAASKALSALAGYDDDSDEN